MKSLLFLSLLILLTACTSSVNDQDIDRTIGNLTAFAKVYGHVKYFHPSDEAMEIDWDKFAIHGVKTVKNAKNDQELKAALEALFTPIAPTVTIYNSEPDKDQFLPAYLEMIGADTTRLKTIGWQHKGVYLGTDRQPYRSSRTHRSDYNLNRAVRISQNLDSKLLMGKEIRMRSSVRSLHYDENSQAELIIVTDGQNLFSKKFDLIDHQNGQLSAELRVELEEETESIAVGFHLQGTADLYIDSVKLEYRNGSSDWTSYPLQNSDFTNDTESGPANWEIVSMGVFEHGRSGDGTFRITSRPKLFNHFPDVGETAVQQISGRLWSEVPLALFSNDEYTLPQRKTSAIEEQLFTYFKNQIDQIDLNIVTTDNENLRLANIVIAWTVFQHFYPYFDVVDVDWDQVLKIALRRALQNQTADEFLETQQWMIAQLQDGHGVVTCQNTTPLYKPAIRVDEIEGEIVVTSSRVSDITVGDIIKSVDRIPATMELENRMELVSGSPQLRKYRALNMFAAGSGENQAIFEVEKLSGETDTLEISRKSSASLFTSIREFDYPAIEMIEDDIYLINLRKITQRAFEENLESLSSANGIIFDYRNGSNSSFSMFNVVPYLTEKEVQSPNWYIPEFIYPDRKNIQFDYSTWSIAPKEPLIRAKNVILNAPRIVSSGETTMGIIDHYNLATLVGDSTAGTNGNTNYIDLPGSCRIMWTGMKVLKHDNSQLHLYGYEPDYPVERTINAVRGNRDEFLEKAIEVITGNAN
ncbi:MAG: hypothetical protein GVY20_09125 [Bacteroidetes bacterium]|nr:hypothetical protein [Bacteroidota bacterium]